MSSTYHPLLEIFQIISLIECIKPMLNIRAQLPDLKDHLIYIYGIVRQTSVGEPDTTLRDRAGEGMESRERCEVEPRRKAQNRAAQHRFRMAPFYSFSHFFAFSLLLLPWQAGEKMG